MRRIDPGMGGPPPEWRSGRFVVRAGQPTAYWVGMRVPFVSNSNERGGRMPPASLLVARIGSLWSLLHLIGLQSWLLAGSAVLLLSVLFWLPLVHSITRSIGQLTAATERIAEGRFDTRVDTRRRDELGRLGESVNRMATQLDTHMTGQKRFLGDVAHELCSPLARLQMATGILTEQAPRELHATVADVREEVQQMSTLVNELLAFTKAGMQPRDIALSPVDLLPLVGEVLAREEATSRVTVSLAADLRVQADAALLNRALGNLVRNALRYAGNAGPIALAAAREGDLVVVTVDDLGPGVPAADLNRLGEPFFRPELARSRETGGVGLGLAIVRHSIAACHGEVRFANREPKGFRAEVRLTAV
jgi:two-component system sensor histidine kinase CpxA